MTWSRTTTTSAPSLRVVRCLVQICLAEACQAMRANALPAHAERSLGCKVHGSSADGLFTLELAYCLDLRASSPAVM